MNKVLIGLAAACVLTTGVALAADVGSPADVSAVRAAAHQKNPSDHTFGVHVVGDYALTDWYSGDASGYAAFKRISGEHWKQIDWDGGATNPQLLSQHGIPIAIAQKLCSGWGDSSPC